MRVNVTDNMKQMMLLLADNSYTVLCHLCVLLAGERCHQREQDCSSSLPCPHRKRHLRENCGTLANCSKVQGKQEAAGELSPCSVPYKLLHKTWTNISFHCGADHTCHVVTHALSFPELDCGPGLLDKQIQTKELTDMLLNMLIKRLNRLVKHSSLKKKRE